MSAVAEGVTTTRAALELAASVGIELPITEQVAKILFEGIDPRYAIHALMTRQPRSEN
jgi:glycerol-3-phosphate dehydrogenase (NAD(P)+)